MRILHTSDLHGFLPDFKGNFDIIINSGDWLPDFPDYLWCGNKIKSAEAQAEWLHLNANYIKDWIQDKPYFFIGGNHDLLSADKMEEILRQNKIDAYNLEDKIVSYHNINLYGFPYVPYINGLFNYECNLPEMKQHTAEMTQVLNNTYVDILVTHAPPYQILDTMHDGQSIGNRCLNNMLDYQLSEKMIPRMVLFGHCHECGSEQQTLNNILFINSACTQTSIQYP